jgi:hypothetical protein
MNAAAIDGRVSNFGGVSTLAEATGTSTSWDYMSGDEDLMESSFTSSWLPSRPSNPALIQSAVP